MATTILVKPTNGTTLAMSSTLPATYDSGGYTAITPTAVGEVLSIGEIAKTYSVISHQSVGRAYPQKIKDVYDIGNVSITMARITSDTGQDIMNLALASANSYTFRITLPSTAVEHFTGKVIKVGLGVISPTGIETVVMDIAVDPESLFEANI